MRSLRLLFFGYVILLLDDAVHSNGHERVYQIKLVKNIAEPSMGKDSYDIDEKNLVDLFPMEKLSELDREAICKEAVAKANEKLENEPFKYVEDDETNSVTKAYLVERQDARPLFTQPKIILAYKCSTQPDMYIQVHDRRQKGVFASLVTIIFREGDVKSAVRCAAEAMLYVDKLVDDISPVPRARVEEARQEIADNTYDTDNFREELRMAMCRRALDVDSFVNRNVKFLKGVHTTDVKRFYYLVVDAQNPSAREVTLAFRCPTIPAVYLEVREIADDESFWVSVIVNRAQLPPKFQDLKYNYLLKTVLSISETSTPVQTQRLPFYHMFEMLLHPNTISEIDANRFTERQRARMCEQAFNAVNQEGGKYLEYLEGVSAGKCGFYRINFELGQSKEVQAFKCPTNPPIFLSVGEREIRQNIWMYIEESEPIDIFPKLNIVGFKMKIVANIVDVPMSSLPKLLQTEDVQRSAIDPDTLSRAKRGQLCEKARQVVAALKIKYFSEVAIEMSRYYKLLDTESAETPQTVKYHILQAYKCPTAPEILLHITERNSDGNVLWIIMKENETLPNMSFTGYQVKTFKKIVSVEPENIGREMPNVPVERSAIRIEKLDEDRRIQMCRTAHKIVSRANMEFSSEAKTETKKYYVVSSESEGKTSRTIVQAFKCPTKPPIYLHIKDDKDKFTVWIMLEETTRTLIVDELRYEVMATPGDITEVKSSELKKESRDNMKKSAIDTDNKLTEGERLQMCLTATHHILGINIFDFVDGLSTGEKKCYAVNVDSGAGTSRSIAQQPIFVEAFRCPTKPPIFLHVDEDLESFAVWVIYKAPPPLIIDELNFEVKIVKKVTELSLTEVKKEPSESVEKLVLDTDLLQEKERRKLCQNALRTALSEMDVEFLKNTNAGKKKYYAVDQYSGLKESPYVRVIVQAFQCPSEPPVYVHINNQELSDAYEAWIILEQALPNTDSLSYRFKVVNRISAVPSTELISKRARAESDGDAVDPNEFPPEYRFRLCEKAVEKISKDYVEILPNRDPSGSQYYYYQSIETQKQNGGANKEEAALAFKCPTDPEIYIEVRKQDEKYFVWILVKDLDLRDEGEEICYLVQFVESIVPVVLSESKAAAASSTEVNTDMIKMRKRSRMCKEARKQEALIDMDIQPTVDSSVENRYLKDFYAVQLASGERYNVEAFGCPTEPPIYLQIRCWKSRCHIVSVIVEKKISRAPSPIRDARRSREVREESDSEEEYIEYRMVRTPKGKHQMRARDSSMGSRKLRDVSADSRRSRRSGGSLGSFNWDEPPADSAAPVDSQDRGALKSPRTKGATVSRQVDEDVSQLRKGGDSSSSVETYDDIPQPTSVKHIDSVEMASEKQISMMPSARREKSMVDADTAYTKEQRKRMCRAAIHFLQPMDDVEFLDDVEIGPCHFYNVHVRPLINRAGKQKTVRAFACPTEPRIYLEVRHREHSETATMSVLVKNKSFVTFELKLANTIGKITSVTQTYSGRRNERDSDDETLVNAKRLHVCRRVIKIMKKLVKGSIEFFNLNSVSDDHSYILNLGAKDAERVRAFQCPCEPDIYLQTQPQVGYTKVSIIVLASIVSSPLEYAESHDYLSSRHKIDATKISYTRRLVLNITPDKSSTDEDEQFVSDEQFVPDERDSICSEAVKLFPDVEFTFVEGFPERSRIYILDAQYQSRDTVRAFQCNTMPPIYVHVEGSAATGYKWASVIMVTKKNKSRSVSSDGASLDRGTVIDNIRYKLVPVIDIDIANRRVRSFAAEDIPPVPRVQYTREEREEICANCLDVLGPGKDLIELKEKPKDEYAEYLCLVEYESERGNEKIISAFKCPTDPQIYIEMGWDDASKMGFANVMIKREHLPVPFE